MKNKYFLKYSLYYLLFVLLIYFLTKKKPFLFFDNFGLSNLLFYLFGENIVTIKRYLLSGKFLIKDDFKVPDNNILINIFLAASLTLFLELAIIRIHSIYIHIFSFFKNISLFSCFFGLGIGYALGNKKLFSLKWTYPLLCIQVLFLYIV